VALPSHQDLNHTQGCCAAKAEGVLRSSKTMLSLLLLSPLLLQVGQTVQHWW
jgi:hypothetical protein